ncbi:DUF1501 domain-containing protein [Paucibacter sp. B2R-40]|uniref:DUF1501 domain-containing protein n=1 Tax=unclassified Roseateles TaxID=2626991 RepID=UPI0021E37C67|nr:MULTISPECIES: DUF1501 domain-containing protein [unclassified Roseateles]MCV2355667.1 DUF1501 domain-containing protein [Paucibacter sp. B2R-40]MCV2361268.1 DUF1501 domain-containing protein [Paucibacter sp. TC2R-5]
MSNTTSRRNFLGQASAAAAAASGLTGLGISGAAWASELDDPQAPKQPHFPAKAKAVIWLHMAGAPSSLDLYDYKPDLIKLNGKPLPDSFAKNLKTATDGGVGNLLATKRTWKQYGETGAWVSDWLPNIAKQVDDIAFLKGSKTDGSTHVIASLKLHTAGLVPGRPALGAWVQYALGSNNPDLPAFVVLPTGKGAAGGGRGQVIWSSGFLPAVFQGTAFRQGDSPILHLARPDLVSDDAQRNALSLLKELNERQSGKYAGDTELQARTKSYDMAYRMQTSAPEAVDLSKESAATKALYGIGTKETDEYGTALLRARRLVERGVRFVHCISGAPDNSVDSWDAHNGIERNHSVMTKQVDKPVAALLADLKALGLLETTLVVWTSEFGRTPYGQSGNGRDHNPWGYTQWVAGGGIKPGTYGATDEVGLRAVSGIVDTYDLQATILHQLGLDHKKVTFTYQGRAERPATVFGEVVKDILA